MPLPQAIHCPKTIFVSEGTKTSHSAFGDSAGFGSSSPVFGKEKLSQMFYTMIQA